MSSFYKLAICDDNPTDCDYVYALVQNWAESKNISIKINTFPFAESFLFHYAEEKDYDMLLLDVEMGEMDGVTMAKAIRKQNETVQIIFITGYSDYIAEGYEVDALHYLMKPVREEKLFEVLTRACEKIKKNERCLYLDLSGEMIRIAFFEIYYVDVQKNYVTIHTETTTNFTQNTATLHKQPEVIHTTSDKYLPKNKHLTSNAFLHSDKNLKATPSFTMKKTLSELEAQLDDRFFRIGRSCIVNLDYISRVTKTTVFLMDGTELPLPRGSYESLNRAIIDHH